MENIILVLAGPVVVFLIVAYLLSHDKDTK